MVAALVAALVVPTPSKLETTASDRRASWVSEKPVWAVVWSNGAWRLKEVTQSAPLDDGNDHC